MSKTHDTARSALEHIMEHVWKGKKTAALNDAYHAQARIAGLLPEAALSREEFAELVQQFSLLVDVLDWVIEDDFSDGATRYFARVSMQVRLNSNMRVGRCDMNVVFTMDGPLITQAHMLIDTLTFLEQLGALPQGALFIAFAGGEFS